MDNNFRVSGNYVNVVLTLEQVSALRISLDVLYSELNDMFSSSYFLSLDNIEKEKFMSLKSTSKFLLSSFDDVLSFSDIFGDNE